ncbi:MAG: GNAT family N-acetyltransferase [Candidatus Bathyarchaeota archaeon]|nr:MAG: GNAT family N-acetyltransferase [Candidatus Bathyarchaeota archaeon]
MKITIREARVEDIDTINELTDQMHRFLADLYELELTMDELEEEHFEDEIRGVYVAEGIGGGVVGYMSFARGRSEWAGPYYEIEHIAVREDHRGLGAGRMLFETLLKKAKKERVNITTGTLARNERALSFYEGLGFKKLSVGLLLDLQNRIEEKGLEDIL